MVALLEAIGLAGSQKAFAVKLGLKSQGTVSSMIRYGRVSRDQVLNVEEKFGISRERLRPDMYPQSMAPSAPPMVESPSTPPASVDGGRASKKPRKRAKPSRARRLPKRKKK